ncbi:hypothetical protein GCM10011487_55220 [Steroidobacter agaridevorans]|uniref:Uncharacterized protein n=1 Tax=Steroidobacter agaridevorans TaxID=2695856 RepID=A0A829YL36_9GAMM|nr:hypothetical protein [Steroidobacter agaridevorans]GFE83522.1 hypothetical protein GCM10011487_55220 [Steroidobacter agaridevorans]
MNDGCGSIARVLRAAIALMAVIGASQSAHAAGAGWTAYGRVLEIYPSNTGTFYVNIDMDTSSITEKCSYTGWFANADNNSAANRVFAALLSAHATGAPVRVYVTGACSSDYYTLISSASVRN